jgi:RHS repeat-associated protein
VTRHAADGALLIRPTVLAGRITTLDEAGNAANDQNFGYDAADRLTAYAGPPTTRAYTYDANGNRSSQSIAGMVTDIVMQANSNRIAQVGSAPVSHEAMGNITWHDGAQLRYDVEGRLEAVISSVYETDYRYDGYGRRVAKFGNWGGVADPVFLYAYDTANHLIGEYRQNGTPIREYVWLGELPVAAIDYHPDGSTTAYAIETDHLGTPRLLTDATQTPRWRWTSPPFGDAAPQENPEGLGAVVFNLRFPGQYYDAESGLSYNWHRVYDANGGRYVQSDPIGLNGGWNTYGYVSGNPMMFIDPTGLMNANGSTTVGGPLWGGRGGVGGGGYSGGGYSGAGGARGVSAARGAGAVIGGAGAGIILSTPGDTPQPDIPVDREIWWPERMPGKWVCKARADCNDNIPGNCPPNPKHRFAFGGGVANDLGTARNIAKGNATSNLMCQPKHVSCKCTGPKGEQYSGGC